MPFQIEELNKLLPPDISEQKKNRLREGLKQFNDENTGTDKNYTDFYSPLNHEFFLQGDLIRELRFPEFDPINKTYEKKYYDAILISNTCDMDINNNRKIDKEVIIAKIIPLHTYQNYLQTLNVPNIDSIINQVKRQLFSNLLYLPAVKQTDYIAYLDKLSYISGEELNCLKPEMDKNRIATLDLFGHYLFTFKMSYHFCRLPEDSHRYSIP